MLQTALLDKQNECKKLLDEKQRQENLALFAETQPNDAPSSAFAELTARLAVTMADLAAWKRAVKLASKHDQLLAAVASAEGKANTAELKLVAAEGKATTAEGKLTVAKRKLAEVESRHRKRKLAFKARF